MKRNREPRDLFGNAVGSTLAVTLFARARGAEMFGVTDWDDPQAREMWSALEDLAAQQDQRLEDLVVKDPWNVVGTIRRSQDIDARVRSFAEPRERTPTATSSPPRSQVATLGLGMCNRASRLADLDVDWIGIDNADVVALRRRLLPDEPIRLVAGSVTERTWLAEIDPSRPTLLIAEGLLMYLDRPHVTQLISRIGDHFVGPTQFVADMHHTMAAAVPTPITRSTGAVFDFGAESPQWFAELVPGWRLVSVDDTMSRIGPASAQASRAFQLFSRGMLYGVVTIERDPG